jgi:hypothetical protein
LLTFELGLLILLLLIVCLFIFIYVGINIKTKRIEVYNLISSITISIIIGLIMIICYKYFDLTLIKDDQKNLNTKSSLYHKTYIKNDDGKNKDIDDLKNNLKNKEKELNEYFSSNTMYWFKIFLPLLIIFQLFLPLIFARTRIFRNWYFIYGDMLKNFSTNAIGGGFLAAIFFSVNSFIFHVSFVVISLFFLLVSLFLIEKSKKEEKSIFKFPKCLRKFSYILTKDLK